MLENSGWRKKQNDQKRFHRRKCKEGSIVGLKIYLDSKIRAVLEKSPQESREESRLRLFINRILWRVFRDK